MPINADANGKLTCKFTIPAGIPSGKKRVTLQGDNGAFGETFFEGKGELWQESINTLKTITNVTNVVTTNYYQASYGIGWYGKRWYDYPYQWKCGYWDGQWNWYWGYYKSGWYDPLAQTFRLTETKQIAGVELYVKAKGATEINVQIRKTQNGVPTDNVLTVSSKQPADITVNQWNVWEFPEPVLLDAEEEYAIVVLCNDADAELGIAEMGKWDGAAQKWVTQQPYTVGVLLSSSNASSWTIHQDRDLAFRLLAPVYAVTTKEITLGTVTLTNATDIALAAEHLIPSVNCKVTYTITMPDLSVLSLTPGFGIQLAAPVSGVATIKAQLTGISSETPIVAPGAQIVHGAIATSGVYVSRAIAAGTSVKIVLIVDAKLPTGATLMAEWRGVDQGYTWTQFAAPTSVALDTDLAELTYTVTGVTEDMVQVRLTLAGDTDSRPVISNLRLYTA